MIQVLLVDDHVATRERLAAVIEADPDLRVVAQAKGLEDVVRSLQVAPPVVVVVDLNLPSGSGLALCRRIWRANGTRRILGLTDGRDMELVADAFEAGAHGVVFKGASPCIIREAVHMLARGDVFLDPAAAVRLLGLEAGRMGTQALEE